MEHLPDGTITSPIDFLAGATACGLKNTGALDLTLILSQTECNAAAVFTQNQFPAAPVLLDKETLAANPSKIRGIVANAGIANACTGQDGIQDARATQRMAADSLSCDPGQILVLSTGVIGVPLDMEKISNGIQDCINHLATDHGREAAEAIMTTDTHPKHSGYSLMYTDRLVTIGGIAKGAGMIHPNMATMLAVLTTDASIPHQVLQELLLDAIDLSFNRISIDGDTSTNDTVLLLANGASGVTLETDEQISRFANALNRTCMDLAHGIVRDGEGVSKFVTLHISGAHTECDAIRIAETIATSPLVKTAFAGGDPNWGRILAAAGRAGVELDPDRVYLSISDGITEKFELVRSGTPTEYDEAQASVIFDASEIFVHLDLNQGDREATYWTCDLTHEYVSINAEYRT